MVVLPTPAPAQNLFSQPNKFASPRALLPAVPDDELVVESLEWVEPGHLLLCASQLQDEEEAGDAYLMHLTWHSGAAPMSADDAKLSAFIPFAIEVRTWGVTFQSRLCALMAGSGEKWWRSCPSLRRWGC